MARPQNPLAAQWANQYTATRPSMESAWAAASGQALVPTQSSSIDSGMWSAEFLDNVDNKLLQHNDFTGQLADTWAEEFGEQMPDLWKNMESEWESIQV